VRCPDRFRRLAVDVRTPANRGAIPFRSSSTRSGPRHGLTIWLVRLALDRDVRAGLPVRPSGRIIASCRNSSASGWMLVGLGLRCRGGTCRVLAHLPNTSINAVKVDASENIYVAGFQERLHARLLRRLRCQAESDARRSYIRLGSRKQVGLRRRLDIDSTGARMSLARRNRPTSGYLRRVPIHHAGPVRPGICG